MNIGKYEDLEEICTSGFSGVYIGVTPETGKKVVLKQARLEKAAGAKDQIRASEYILRHEFEIIQKLCHSNIIKAVECDVRDRHGTLYMVTESIGAKTLLEVAEDGCIGNVVKALADTAKGLVHAHGRNIIHRDIKPDNIGVNGSTKIFDWECAHDICQDKGKHRKVPIGTPAYMSPAQFTADTPQFEDDVYSFAVTAFYALTKEFPYKLDADDVPDFSKENFNEDSLKKFKHFGEKVIRSLSVHPEERATMRELAASARQFYKNTYNPKLVIAH